MQKKLLNVNEKEVVQQAETQKKTASKNKEPNGLYKEELFFFIYSLHQPLFLLSSLNMCRCTGQLLLFKDF
ncbi:hypothetical protein GCM10020331_102680 [Ectobacillus funiculus]